MDRLSVLDARQVKQTLVSNLAKEKRLWKPIVINSQNDKEINERQRDEAAAWLAHLAAEFKFLPETCGLAILLLDKLLHAVKIRPKCLLCVSVTCLYIAAKTLEEDENIPPTPDLVRRSRCGCSFAEITRMEIVVLTKLDWNVRIPSAIDFLHTIHAVLLMHYPHLLSGANCIGPSDHLVSALRKLMRCLTTHTLLAFRPSTVALALISLEMEQLTPGWLRIVSALQRMMSNVGTEQLMQCRELMAEFLGQHPLSTCVNRPRKSSSSAPQSKKRKVEHIPSEVDDEDIYDGIRQLYSEEDGPSSDANTLRTSCSLEMHQDNDENTKKNTAGLLGQVLLVS